MLLPSLLYVILIGFIGSSELVLKLAFDFEVLASIFMAIISPLLLRLMTLNFKVTPLVLNYFLIFSKSASLKSLVIITISISPRSLTAVTLSDLI